MLKKLFGFDSTKTTVKTEILAGITTFLTMSYILAVNPSMFSELDMPGGAVFTSTYANMSMICKSDDWVALY